MDDGTSMMQTTEMCAYKYSDPPQSLHYITRTILK